MIEILNILGYISTVIVLGGFLIGLVNWARGIFPAIFRLGKGLANRKIAILASGDNQSSLKSLLLDSGLFKKNNITEVTSMGDFGRAENSSVYLVFWHDWEDDFEKLFSRTKDGTALIVYAPLELGIISDEHLKLINEKRHATVTNFRGRLLNDIVISMITTGFD